MELAGPAAVFALLMIGQAPGNSMTGNSFYEAVSEPVDAGNGNVVFPSSWSQQQARDWRIERNLPGAEWHSEK